MVMPAAMSWPPPLTQVGAAGLDGGDEGNPGNRAGGAFAQAVSVKADDESRAVEVAHDAGGHDADHAGMPVVAGEDESGRVAEGGGHCHGLEHDAVLDLLALAVLVVEQAGEFFGGRVVLVVRNQTHGGRCRAGRPHSGAGRV